MKTRNISLIITGVIAVGIAVSAMLFVDTIPPRPKTYLSMHFCRLRIQIYALEHNALPLSLSQTEEIEGRRNTTKDAWGRDIIYTSDPNGLVTLTSLGKDNYPGGTGDDADMVGIYPSRQEGGSWSDVFVQWSKDPLDTDVNQPTP